MPYRYITLDYERYAERGDTIRFKAVFKDKEKVLTDPSSPLVKIYRGSVLITSLTPVRDSLGEYHVDYTVPSDATTGPYVLEWSGSIDAKAV